ncbi:hypothetical protein AHIS1636_07410 [Arthrobacter mangrovi]|uniref:Uncharacterized protein n=1 Tax=Arthrobacter mangrovi TaxID=2966350 RepID=A0ABQ5MRQ1_9MICC|nr:hypothetical protein AHIS1636_07410 [Arthrobacter mangrovi]
MDGCSRAEVAFDGAAINFTPKGSVEGTPLQSQGHARGIRVQPGTPPGRAAAEIDDDGTKAVRRDGQTQQAGLVILLPAANAGTLRRLPGRPDRIHSSAFGKPATNRAGRIGQGGYWTATASETMSIRQPVSLAARRAFWPSLPMASDSW